MCACLCVVLVGGGGWLVEAECVERCLCVSMHAYMCMTACDVRETRQTNNNFSASQLHHMTAAIFVCLAMSHMRLDWHL